MEGAIVLIILGFGFALVVFWIVELVNLMLLTSEELGGPYDKLIWGAVFIVLPPLAPFAFRIWRYAALAARRS